MAIGNLKKFQTQNVKRKLQIYDNNLMLWNILMQQTSIKADEQWQS